MLGGAVMDDVRLIDANALKIYKFETSDAFRGFVTVIPFDLIATAPTIDAVPVVHGRWEHNDLGHTYCSKCHERLPFMHCYTEEPCSDYEEEWDEEIPETRYCPNCGAKMDGGAEG
jgi:hypothetical protein